MMHRILSALMGLALSLAAIPAGAEPLDPTALDPTLKGLAFGMSRDQVVQVLKKRASDRYDAQIRNTMDTRERDQFTRDKDAAVASVGNDVVAFDGRRTGWDASVVRREFVHGLGEEMLHVKEGEVHLYLFFAKGVYYKLIRTPGAKPVSEALAELENVYGPPAATTFQDPKAHKGVQSAAWKAGTLTLQIDDQATLYQCAPVRWALASADAEVQAEWAKGRHADGLNPLVHQAQQPGTTDADPVDAMIGSAPPKAPAAAPRTKKPKPKPQQGK